MLPEGAKYLAIDLHIRNRSYGFGQMRYSWVLGALGPKLDLVFQYQTSLPHSPGKSFQELGFPI